MHIQINLLSSIHKRCLRHNRSRGLSGLLSLLIRFVPLRFERFFALLHVIVMSQSFERSGCASSHQWPMLRHPQHIFVGRSYHPAALRGTLRNGGRCPTRIIQSPSRIFNNCLGIERRIKSASGAGAAIYTELHLMLTCSS